MSARGFTLDEQLLEVLREMAVRRKVYPDLIRRGTMRRVDANRQYMAMAAVELTLRGLIEKRDGKQLTIENQ